jgi:class 3 adenylate cyclase
LALEIDKLITKLVLESQEDRWIVIVFEIVKRFGTSAEWNILDAIEHDSLTGPDATGIVSTRNSPKWNSLALTYLQNGSLETALALFQVLFAREPNNPQTQNNYGVVLIRVGNLSKAKELFTKAFETDKKREPELAEKLPAYQNLMLFKEGKPRSEKAETIASPSFHSILFMDIVGFSRPSWYATIQVEKITYLTNIVRTLLGEFGLDFMKVPMLPTGDGMALFFEIREHPIRLAIELTKRLDEYNEKMEKDMKLELRIGIHAGDSFPVNDLHNSGNRCGPAINTARRVLDLGEARQVLCTQEYGDELKRLFGPTYGSLLHDCGEYTVKHGEKINVYNIYDRSFGNPKSPPK